MIYKKYFKRLADIIICIVLIIILLPLYVITIIILKIFQNNTDVFFTQKRPGKDGKIFNVIKFKTMNDNRNAKGELLPVKERITRIGRIIRLLSIDELPQIFNVLKGDMSLVGPRPLLIQYLDLYSPTEARRHEVRPGITGWAQINGRNSITWKQKFEYDVWYVDNVSFVLDLKIIFITIKNVFERKDINSNKAATMPTFNGSN